MVILERSLPELMQNRKKDQRVIKEAIQRKEERKQTNQEDK